MESTTIFLTHFLFYLPVFTTLARSHFQADDEITALPGQPFEDPNFCQYAGYITVDPNKGRNLFYYFVEAPTDPTLKPLLLWLNGGPGCSSLGYGAMQGVGPFRVNSQGKLYKNEYAWNKVANIIFLESPVGVGFSYSNTSSDYQTNGDKRTAEDSLTFLVNWLERFPAYKGRDFFIAGESYAGHYVPQLAKLILQRNDTDYKPINLKGIAIGNAALDDTLTVRAAYEFLRSHAMLSDETYESILQNCNLPSVTSPECELAFSSQVGEEAGINFTLFDPKTDPYRRIDQYNVYAPLCITNRATSSNEYDPCAGAYVSDYLNNPLVQSALHAVPSNWKSCSRPKWSDAEPTMQSTMKQLIITTGIRVWLYSGDMDAVVSVTSTKAFIKLLELPIERPWRPWYTATEVGGYVVAYKGLTFVTVRGAGHAVPSNQGERALYMISSFIEGSLP